MAGKLNLSMGSIRNYESATIKAPDPRALYAYILAAETGNRADLAAVFREVLYSEIQIHNFMSGGLAIEPTDSFEQILVAGLLATIRKDEFAKFRKRVLTALVEPCKTLTGGMVDKGELQEQFSFYLGMKDLKAAEKVMKDLFGTRSGGTK